MYYGDSALYRIGFFDYIICESAFFLFGMYRCQNGRKRDFNIILRFAKMDGFKVHCSKAPMN